MRQVLVIAASLSKSFGVCMVIFSMKHELVIRNSRLLQLYVMIAYSSVFFFVIKYFFLKPAKCVLVTLLMNFLLRIVCMCQKNLLSYGQSIMEKSVISESIAFHFRLCSQLTRVFDGKKVD